MADKLRDKSAWRQSPSTTWRERPPTAPDIAQRGNVRMSIDYSHQQPVVPHRLGQTTRYGENDANFRTMNANGRPLALDTMVGAGPDNPSHGFGPGNPSSGIKGK